MDYGFQAVLSPRFADIFRNNCGKMGLVAATVDHDGRRSGCGSAIEEDPDLEIVVDVEHKRVAAPAIGLDEPFELDDFTQYRLVNGLDDIGLTLRNADAIERLRSVAAVLEAFDHFVAVISSRLARPDRRTRR